MNCKDCGSDNIHTLVCSQGIVAYDRKEFEIDTFKKIIDLNLNSVMASCSFFHENLVNKIQSQFIIILIIVKVLNLIELFLTTPKL